MRLFLFLFSFILVAFGQPAWHWGVGLVAATSGYALVWYALCDMVSSKQRFWLATGWFSLVQIVQLSWLIAHPYFYIWIIYLGLSLALGFQFGLLSLLVCRANLQKIWKVAAMASLWVLLEWARLSVLSGFSWNPVGIALSGQVYPLQLASIAGIYGLSFWVMFVNLLLLRTLIFKKYWLSWITAAAFPYLFGFFHIAYHEDALAASPTLSALLVQTAFPIEECLDCTSSDLVRYVESEWRQIFTLLNQNKGQLTDLDLIAFPEYLVPFGTWTPLWPWSRMQPLIIELGNRHALAKLPPLEEPWARLHKGEWFVSNAFLLQSIANLFDVEVISGLEDAELRRDKVEYYNAALMFEPCRYHCDKRYLKRVLVPMGEYIPFEWCQKLAASYGISGSFTPGLEAQVFRGKKWRYGVSICYEETYAHLMRENKQKGADVLLNLTSDVWYPNSRLTQQHLDHARLRSVEGGLPLLRACNTGITCAIDSLGRTIATLGLDEWQQAVLKVKLPIYHYKTLYTQTGDTLLLSFSAFMSLLLYLRRKDEIP